MKKKAGVWIDGKKAFVVYIEGGVTSFQTLLSDIETRERVEGEVKDSGRFGHQFHDHQKARDKKLEREREAFIKSVISELTEVESLVIFGPANMKNELKKGLDRQFRNGDLIRDVLPADSMTENQFVAMVVNYFGRVAIQ